MDTAKTGGNEGMKKGYRKTPEEEAYGRLLNESEEVLSESARTVLEKAEATAHAEHLVRSYCLHPEEYDEAMAKMRRAATELTDRECKLLARIWRAALASAASIDPDDETPAGHRVDRGDVHHYYRMVSGMVESTLLEKRVEEHRKAADREPEDFEDIPF
jgi:hypothetical protein